MDKISEEVVGNWTNAILRNVACIFLVLCQLFEVHGTGCLSFCVIMMKKSILVKKQSVKF